tara:strand:- start:377 stop:538 length:162 start_codon:yes stop_codon:yes gene_type:complete
LNKFSGVWVYWSFIRRRLIEVPPRREIGKRLTSRRETPSRRRVASSSRRVASS